MVYRVIGRDGSEVYRGKRSAVIRKLCTLSKRGRLETCRVESGRFKPELQAEPRAWNAEGDAAEFLREPRLVA